MYSRTWQLYVSQLNISFLATECNWESSCSCESQERLLRHPRISVSLCNKRSFLSSGHSRTKETSNNDGNILYTDVYTHYRRKSISQGGTMRRIIVRIFISWTRLREKIFLSGNRIFLLSTLSTLSFLFLHAMQWPTDFRCNINAWYVLSPAVPCIEIARFLSLR